MNASDHTGQEVLWRSGLAQRSSGKTQSDALDEDCEYEPVFWLQGHSCCIQAKLIFFKKHKQIKTFYAPREEEEEESVQAEVSAEIKLTMSD